jgi:tol-pal system protein YbgF
MFPQVALSLRPRRVLLGAVLAATLAAPALGAPLFDTRLPPSAIGEPVLVAQNNQQAAQIAVRIQQLEEQIRVLTGQVEGLTFQLTQMQVMIQKMQEDNEFRFQELEGGAPPATQSGAVTTEQTVQPDPNAVAVADPSIVTIDPSLQNPSTLPSDPTMGAPMDNLPMENVGESMDPMVGAADPNAGQLGTLPQGDVALNQPLDLTLNGTPVNGDAQAQYNAGYDALVRGDYTFAEEQFRQFVALYPQDPQAPDATNWLGETLLQRGAYDEAADVLLTGFQNYPQSGRAPNLLLNLGVALSGAGERETACRTFGEVRKRYGNATPAFTDRLTQEEARAECPPA